MNPSLFLVIKRKGGQKEKGAVSKRSPGQKRFNGREKTAQDLSAGFIKGRYLKTDSDTEESRELCRHKPEF
jgi:hypothetical protein